MINYTKTSSASELPDLSVVEREIWATNFDEGKLAPIQPKYWDINPDETVPIYLR